MTTPLQLEMLYDMFPFLEHPVIADVFYRSGCNSSISAEHLLQLSAEAPVLASIAAASAAAEQEQRYQIAAAPRRKDPFATLAISSVKNIARFMSIEDLVSFSAVSRECKYLSDTELCGVTILRNSSGIRSWSDSRIISMFSRFPALTAASLSKCENFSSFFLLPSVLGSRSCFTRLVLSHTSIEDGDVLYLVQGLQNLQHLDLSYTYISDAALEHIARVQPTNLTRLELAGCTYLTDYGVTLLLSRNMCLRKLDLRKTFVSSSVLQHCSALTHLHLPHCKALHQIHLEEPSWTLQTLVLSANTNLKTVTCNLPQLRYINLSSCKQLISLHLTCPQLLSLNLSGCSNLANGSFNVVRLQELNLYNCRSLLPNALESLFRHSRDSLISVFAHGLIQLRNDIAERFAASCPFLESFDLIGCRGLSKATILRIKAILKDNARRKIEE